MGDQAVLHGRKGWLKFFIVLMFLRPLAAAGNVNSALILTEADNPSLIGIAGWQELKMALWAYVAAIAFVSVVSGCVLALGKTHSAVRLAIFTLWLAPLVTFLGFALVASSVALGDKLGSEIGVSATFQSFFFALICTAYLMLSRRVKATYP